MSKYIPGNQKHLTLEDRIYIENELNKGTSFKDIARFLCKDPTTISKEVRLTGSRIGIIKGLSIMPKTSVPTAITAGRQMPAERLSCAASNAHPVLPVTRPAKTSKKNAAQGLTGLPMSVTAVRKKSVTARSPTNTLITPGLLTGSIGKHFGIPEQGST